MEKTDRIDRAVKVVGNDLKLAYSFAQAVDILLASVARRLSAFGGMKHEKIKAERDRLRLEKIVEARQKKHEHDAEMRKIHPCYDCLYFENCDSLSYDSVDRCEDYTEDPFADD